MHFREFVTVGAQWVRDLAYGENRRQKRAALCKLNDALYSKQDDPLALHKFVQVDGDVPGFVNLTDMDRILNTLIRVVVAHIVNLGVRPRVGLAAKHGNICGGSVRFGDDANDEALVTDVINGDPQDVTGGCLIFNIPLTERIATILRRHEADPARPRVLDVIIAPSVSPEALAILKRKDNRCRVFVNPALAHIDRSSIDDSPKIRMVRGGLLIQDGDPFVLDFSAPFMEVYGEFTTDQQSDLCLAWGVCSTGNSNQTTAVRNNMVIANAVGQQSRIGSVMLLRQRAEKAGHSLRGTRIVTDSFFIKNDAPIELVALGVDLVLASITPPPASRWEEVRRLMSEAQRTLLGGPDTEIRGFANH